MKATARIILSSATSILALSLSLTATQALAQSDTVDFDIDAQPLAKALMEYSEQTNIVVMASAGLVEGKKTDGIEGADDPVRALDSLLASTGLEHRFVNDETVVIGEVSTDESDEDVEPGKSQPASSLVLMAQNQTSAERNRTQTTSETTSDEDEKATILDEIVVTGSNIRGVRSASPVFVFDRKDIDQTGVATLPEFFQTVPQNFGGGVTETTGGVVPSGSTNLNRGSGINLRGLGNDSTLVLLNGRRLAPAGQGDFVDISLIPLTAIERVEVLTDGASAIYGSDAVGGVVNFRLRTDYDGAETRLRYGTATSGDLDSILLGQTFGKTWGTGHALISYEYSQRDGLDANDRDFAEDSQDPTFLLPEQDRRSAFATVGQRLSETIDVFGDAFYSQRDSRSATVDFSRTVVFSDSQTEQYGASLGSRAALGKGWQTELVGAFSQNSLSRSNTVIETDVTTEFATYDSKTWSLDGKVDGSLLELPGGAVKLAVGGQYRHEAFDNIQPSRSSGVRPDIVEERDIYAFFGEMFIPLVGKDNSVAGVERLELTVAGRHENYSDFGSSTDSKFGLLWSPFEGVNIRGTYGTSFRAPQLAELDTGTTQGFLFPLPNPSSSSGTTLAAVAYGGNPDLQPETATTWTAGVDIAPLSMQGLDIQATYFNIDFRNRIASNNAFFDAFSDPRWEPIVDFNPAPAFLAFLDTQPFSFNFAPGFTFADAEAVVDNRLLNLAQVQTSGLDFTISYLVDSDNGSLGFNLGGTYLFEQVEQLTATTPSFDLVDIIFNPSDLKLRGGINWAHKGFASNLAVNYVDSYRDERIDPVADVSSWTTVDLTISYDTGDHSDSALLSNTFFSFSAINLFDRDPPFVESFSPEIANFSYDPANASPVGRTVAFQITKQWW